MNWRTPLSDKLSAEDHSLKLNQHREFTLSYLIESLYEINPYVCVMHA